MIWTATSHRDKATIKEERKIRQVGTIHMKILWTFITMKNTQGNPRNRLKFILVKVKEGIDNLRNTINFNQRVDKTSYLKIESRETSHFQVMLRDYLILKVISKWFMLIRKENWWVIKYPHRTFHRKLKNIRIRSSIFYKGTIRNS
jgi:hypothetical protein